MTIAKNIFALLLVAVLSAAVIFLPQLWDSHDNHRRLTQEKEWNYIDRVSANITASQVAALYCEGELNNIYSDSLSFDLTVSERERLRESASAIINDVFGEGSTVSDLLGKRLEDKSDYSKQSVLAIIDGHAIVLNFISVYAEEVNFVFEEKTKLVISFSFASDYGTLISESGISENEIGATVKNYYSPILKDTPHQFYFFNRESLGDEESQKYDLFFTDFGLLRYEYEKDMSEIHFN